MIGEIPSPFRAKKSIKKAKLKRYTLGDHQEKVKPDLLDPEKIEANNKLSMEIRSDSLDGCAMSAVDKCYGAIPPDGSAPSNLIEKIGEVQNVEECQWFCKEIYTANCTYFLYDRTTDECKLFDGLLEEFKDDCNEVGYANEPSHEDCDTTFDYAGENGCYNFREAYCRFDMDLLDNLEHVQSLTLCQLACQHRSFCNFFVYFEDDLVCKLQTTNFANRICDIVHGTPEPAFQLCLDESKILWADATAFTG